MVEWLACLNDPESYAGGGGIAAKRVNHAGQVKGDKPEKKALVLCTGAQKWHIVSLLGDVTSPSTVAHYVSMTCSEHREALTASPTADGVHIQAIRVQG